MYKRQCVHRLVDYKNLWPYARDLYQIPAFRHNTYFKDFAASEDLTHAPEDYWENVYYDIVVQETDWDTIWSQPTGREALSKDPVPVSYTHLENANGEYIRLKDISARQGITLKYMEQIMPMLTKAGYVRSYRGNNGGYMLAKEPEEYTAGDIIRTTEGSLAPIACLDDVPNRCERQDQCSTLEFWEGLKKVIDQYVDKMCIRDSAQAIQHLSMF